MVFKINIADVKENCSVWMSRHGRVALGGAGGRSKTREMETFCEGAKCKG